MPPVPGVVVVGAAGSKAGAVRLAVAVAAGGAFGSDSTEVAVAAGGSAVAEGAGAAKAAGSAVVAGPLVTSVFPTASGGAAPVHRGSCPFSHKKKEPPSAAAIKASDTKVKARRRAGCVTGASAPASGVRGARPNHSSVKLARSLAGPLEAAGVVEESEGTTGTIELRRRELGGGLGNTLPTMPARDMKSATLRADGWPGGA